MSDVPEWLGATAGSQGNGGQINQYLAAHTAVFVYSGASVVSQQSTGTGVYLDSLSQWLSQTIVTGASQTTIGSVSLQLSAVGGSPTLALIPAITVALYADAAGYPSGAALASVALPCPYVYSSPFWVSCPLGATGLSPSTPYHLVTNLVGTSGHYYLWQESNQATGAATAPDGATWTDLPTGLMYQVLGSGTGQLAAISEDGGAQVTTLTYNSIGLITGVSVQTLAQDGTYITSSGTLAYTNGLLTGVS